MSVSSRDIVPIKPNVVPSFVQAVNLDMYFRVAIITVLVYDAAITMDREVKYFWKIPKKMANFAYFANRYVGIFSAAFQLYLDTFNPRLATCNAADWALNITSWATIILLDYILMIRVLALYSNDRMLSIILKTLLAMEVEFKLGLIIYLVRLNHYVIGELARDVTICVVISIAPLNWIMVDWIIPMVYGTILMILAVYRAAEYWRISAGFKGFKPVKVLVRDQVLYFMLVISCSVFSIIGNKLEISSLFLGDVLAVLGSPVWLSCLGSRMFLNLKEAGEEGRNEGTNYSISDIDFGDPGNNRRESGAEGVESADGGDIEA